MSFKCVGPLQFDRIRSHYKDYNEQVKLDRSFTELDYWRRKINYYIVMKILPGTYPKEIKLELRHLAFDERGNHKLLSLEDQAQLRKLYLSSETGWKRVVFDEEYVTFYAVE